MQHGWDIEFTDEFGRWWDTLPLAAQEAIAHDVEVVGHVGPALGRPLVDSVRRSRHANMKELRTRHRRSAFRILFAFDPRRSAILLMGGDKTGNQRFYAQAVREADRLYDEHLETLRKEGRIR